MESKIWLITGVSRGLGLALAQAVLARGDRVVGTTRSGRSDLPASDRLSVVRLDVTDRQQAFDAIAAAHALHGRLDVVVNNAGFGLLGAIEDASPAEVADVMAVNFHGPLNVVQAVLPLLRSQGSGRIINIASIAGLAPGAGSGIYAAAKFALVGLTVTLAQEVGPLGIHATVVEPGAFRTGFLSDASLKHSAQRTDAYADSVGKYLHAFRDMNGSQLGDPAKAAAAICRLADSERPPLHLLLGSDAWRRTHTMLDAFKQNLDDWRDVTLGTDFSA